MVSFKDCVEQLGYGVNECNAITEPSPSLLVVATVVAIAIVVGLTAYRNRNN